MKLIKTQEKQQGKYEKQQANAKKVYVNISSILYSELTPLTRDVTYSKRYAENIGERMSVTQNLEFNIN